jgi:hypothetical protein
MSPEEEALKRIGKGSWTDAASRLIGELASSTKDVFLPDIPTNVGGVIHAVTPDINAGTRGVSKLIEEAGGKVGKSVRGSTDKIRDELGNLKYLPGFYASLLAADVMSDQFKPSQAQQQIGAEAIPIAIQSAKPALSVIRKESKTFNDLVGEIGAILPKSSKSHYAILPGGADANKAFANDIKYQPALFYDNPEVMFDNIKKMNSEFKSRTGHVFDNLKLVKIEVPSAKAEKLGFYKPVTDKMNAFVIDSPEKLKSFKITDVELPDTLDEFLKQENINLKSK